MYTTGDNNIAFGYAPLWRNTTGSNNTAVGFNTLQQNTTTDGNVALGYEAGGYYAGGSYNTFIGYSADASGTGYTNATAIGNGASVNSSNKIRLGNTSVTSLESQVALSVSSDRRLKRDIQDIGYGLQTLLEMRPVSYQLKSNNLKQMGFIAQDMKKLVPEVVTGIEGDLEKGEALAITYANLVPVLTKSIKEQQAIIENQQKMIEQLERDMQAIKKRVYE
jgi:hypothetical protein